jgi:hypothetical protein
VANLVAAMATSHAPSLASVTDRSVDQMTRTVFDGFDVLRDHLAAARPDVLLVVSDDHLNTFSYRVLPAFAIGVGDSHERADEGNGRPPAPALAGCPDLAMFLAESGLEAGFDWAIAHEIEIDHGIWTILPLIRPALDLPLIPILQNTTAPPYPTAARCYQLGRFLAEGIARFPTDLRVALVGAGGLSHQLGGKRMGRIEQEFDRHFLDLLTEGPRRRIAEYSNAEIDAHGNGTNEIRNWITVAAAAGDAPASVIAYEPLGITGTGMVIFDV